ncbi:hypothetical protein BLS_002315 [Venturia inaequalis]|uniref:Uncharacterized protein n=1 Tax=Venturia inaequalis TaxID=5025 RepID=A0A8H3YW79_VENIN|nr:hypothetical protein BLS_002315 [Venturia inaequalis]KAE9984711.1 hypothetical protein EG327_004922 [Venturia inaequalis]
MSKHHSPPPSWLDLYVTSVVLDRKEPQDLARTFENGVVSTGDWTKSLTICTNYIAHLVPLQEAAPVPHLGIPIYDAGQVAYISTTETSNGGTQTHCLMENDTSDPNMIRKLILHTSGKYGDAPTLNVVETETEYLASSALRGRMLEFLPYDRKRKELGASAAFTWKYVTLDGKRSLLMEAWANRNRQLAKVERKGNKGQGTMRWKDGEDNKIELWMKADEMKAAGISEAVVVASCLMILRAEIIRRFSIAAWLMDKDEDKVHRIRVE